MKVPCGAPMGEIKTSGELVALLHFVDRCIRERNDFAELSTTDGTWRIRREFEQEKRIALVAD